MENEETTSRHHRLKPLEYKTSGSHLALRNWLNLAFMILAVIGVALYFMVGNTPGTVVMLVAVVIKIVETCIRFIH